uniref:cysteine dioxygenase n=1 Tax=Oryza sativa subsp. japonica TaxID=39947 RepID=Q6YPC3_ORYSJ|nr:HGWP repeat containing protein-like [Oryza sativa Japonica Group]BAD17834.1 HGWP repeat containing protein-like [Oryza sativa Japonica Group]
MYHHPYLIGRWPAFIAADWCLRLHGWPILPRLLGIYDFTAGLPLSPPTGVLAYTVGWLHHRSWAFTSSPTGWPSPPPTCVSACTAGLLCRRCWASTTSPPSCLRRRRLVSSPIRLVGHTTVHGRPRLHCRPASVASNWCPCLYGWLVTPPFMGVHIFTDWLAFAAADWCLRLHGWPIMPPLLGAYDFTTGLPLSPPTGVLTYTLVVTPPLMGIYLPIPSIASAAYTVGVFITVDGLLRSHIGYFCCHRGNIKKLRLPLGRFLAPGGSLDGPSNARMDQSEHHHRLAVVAADWCPRLYGWVVTPPLLGVVVFTDRPPRPPPTGVFAYIVGWSHHHCWASTSSPPACLHRRRLVSPPARLAYYAAVVGCLRLHRPTASFAADWCFCLHGWPIMLPLLDVYIFTDRLPRMMPTGAIVFTVGHVAATANRHHHLQRKLSTSAADWFFHFHGYMILPLLIGFIVFTAGRLVCC